MRLLGGPRWQVLKFGISIVQLQFLYTDPDYTLICWLFYYSIWIHHGCGYRRYLLLAYESYYVWCAALRQFSVSSSLSSTCYSLGGKALGTNERTVSCAHVWQNQKQTTPPPPKVYNLQERRCSFVPLTRQRNTASISSGTIRLNQAPGYSP